MTIRFQVGFFSLLLGLLAATAEAQEADLDCNQCVDTSDIARSAVARARIADRAVSKEKLNVQSVTTGKLARGAVTGAKMADGAVSEDKLSSSLASTINGNMSGVAATAYVNSLATDTTIQVAVQDSIDIPAPGVIVAMANGYVFHNHTNGTEDNTVIHLASSSGVAPVNSIGTTEVRTAAASPTGAYDAVPYAITRTFTVGEAGTQTYYVNCRKSSGASGFCYGNHLTLLYIATEL